MQKIRNSCCRRTPTIDGKNGERIKEFIVEKLQEMEKKDEVISPVWEGHDKDRTFYEEY